MPEYPGKKCFFLCVFSFIVLGSVLWMMGWVLYAGAIKKNADGDGRNQGINHDAIVVLTGGRGRLDTAFALLAESKAVKLFISGVAPHIDLEHLLSEMNIRDKKGHDRMLEKHITLGRAKNTQENAQETLSWVRKHRIRSFLLVTSRYHMPRALFEFHRVMPHVRIIPHAANPVRTDQGLIHGFRVMRFITREYNKFLLTWLRHHVFPSTTSQGRAGL